MRLIALLVWMILIGCSEPKKDAVETVPAGPFVVVLGTLQDGGSPHIGCKKQCCEKLFQNPDKNRQVVSLGLIDPENQLCWLFEATPDIPSQLQALIHFKDLNPALAGIFLTHAHIGHYSGLMYLGKEAMNSKNIPVYAMPRMKSFLENNGPWNQLVTLNNIYLREIEKEKTIVLSPGLRVMAFMVPHRDEFSETVGYRIEGERKKILFIPDIDKWSKWDKNIIEEIKKVDVAFIDGTFYDDSEIQNRNMSEIPHPFVVESVALFKSLSEEEKKKIHFIHFNHTNPLLNEKNAATVHLKKNGFGLARAGAIVEL